MSFIETEASYRIEVINGKPVKIITPQTEITLTNTKTGQEYNSDAEAMQDVQDSNTDTVADDIKRDVKVIVEALPLGGNAKL
jgi:autotransporter adhesin